VGAPTDRRLVPSHGSAFAFAWMRKRRARKIRVPNHVPNSAQLTPAEVD
jgi:hypothetical protein